MPRKTRTTNRGVAWIYREVKALLDIWADHEIQEQLAGRLHNMCIYEKISHKLKVLGFNRTGEQCREKIKKLRRDYRAAVHNNYSPAYARRLLGFYDKVHKIFGDPSNPNSHAANNSTKCSESKHEKNFNLSHSDVEMEISAESFSNNDVDSGGLNETSSIDSDQNSLKATGNQDDTLIQENENMLQVIFQNYTLFIKTLKQKQDSLNDKFMECMKIKDTDKLQRMKVELSLIEYERQKRKSHELKIFKTLLQLIANKNGFHKDFNDILMSALSHSKK